MKNITKKIFFLTIISLFIIPQVTFAAWWNPFTWKIFGGASETKVEKTEVNLSPAPDTLSGTQTIIASNVITGSQSAETCAKFLPAINSVIQLLIQNGRPEDPITKGLVEKDVRSYFFVPAEDSLPVKAMRVYFQSAATEYDAAFRSLTKAQGECMKNDYKSASVNYKIAAYHNQLVDQNIKSGLALSQQIMKVSYVAYYKATVLFPVIEIASSLSGGATSVAISVATPVFDGIYNYSIDPSIPVSESVAEFLKAETAATLTSYLSANANKMVNMGVGQSGLYGVLGKVTTNDQFKKKLLSLIAHESNLVINKTMEAAVDALVSSVFTVNTANAPASTSLISQTLSVSLSAIPSSITAGQNISLKANVLGTAKGTIHYQFDCTNNGSYEVDIVNNTSPYTTSSCSYSSSGTYTAKVHVERGTATPTEATIRIVVTSPVVSTPSMSDTTIKVISPNGGEQWVIGKTYNITWSTDAGTIDSIFLLQEDHNLGGIYIQKTPVNVGANGFYSWTVPSTLTPGSYKISVVIPSSIPPTNYDVGDDTTLSETILHVDSSDDWFSIVSSYPIPVPVPTLTPAPTGSSGGGGSGSIGSGNISQPQPQSNNPPFSAIVQSLTNGLSYYGTWYVRFGIYNCGNCIGVVMGTFTKEEAEKKARELSPNFLGYFQQTTIDFQDSYKPEDIETILMLAQEKGLIPRTSIKEGYYDENGKFWSSSLWQNN